VKVETFLLQALFWKASASEISGCDLHLDWDWDWLASELSLGTTGVAFWRLGYGASKASSAAFRRLDFGSGGVSSGSFLGFVVFRSEFCLPPLG
jgi:hypothetical protein